MMAVENQIFRLDLSEFWSMNFTREIELDGEGNYAFLTCLATHLDVSYPFGDMAGMAVATNNFVGFMDMME